VPRITPTVSTMLKPPGAARPRSHTKDAKLLSTVPLFADLSKRHLRRVASVAGEARFKPGATIVQEGTAGEAFHVIVEGKAKVVHGRRTIARMGPGDFFGEVALLDGATRTASVVAETPLVTVRIYRRAFLKVLESEPTITVKVLAEVARRLRHRTRTFIG
jgi:CRP-like cAMP-binding protein